MIARHYFPDLDARQREQLAALQPLYEEWNARINVVSRKDMEQLQTHHVLHSLAIARACRFGEGARIVDVGTGGGFPGIPLAILFPQARFTLVDSIGKKIRVVEAVAGALGLGNIEALHARAEDLPGKFDYVVSRAVTRLAQLVEWTWDKIERGRAGDIPAGILCLKGGDLTQELAGSGKKYEIFPIGEWFAEEFFETKSVVYLPR